MKTRLPIIIVALASLKNTSSSTIKSCHDSLDRFSLFIGFGLVILVLLLFSFGFTMLVFPFSTSRRFKSPWRCFLSTCPFRLLAIQRVSSFRENRFLSLLICIGKRDRPHIGGKSRWHFAILRPTSKKANNQKRKKGSNNNKRMDKRSTRKTSRTEFGQQMRSLAYCPRTCL